MFDKFGTVERLNVTYVEGQDECWASVVYGSAEETNAAFKEYDGAEIDGKTLEIAVL